MHDHFGTHPAAQCYGLGPILTLALCCSLALPAHAGGTAEIATGRRLASDHCSRCHGIDNENFTLVEGALPLREVKRRYPEQYLVEALAAGGFEIHPEMPVFKFSTDEIAALMAYLDSIW